jgi:hypothetical protein
MPALGERAPKRCHRVEMTVNRRAEKPDVSHLQRIVIDGVDWRTVRTDERALFLPAV